MRRVIGYEGGSLDCPKAGRPIIIATSIYRTYHWKNKDASDAIFQDHAKYVDAKEEAEEWENRGYHVTVFVDVD